MCEAGAEENCRLRPPPGREGGGHGSVGSV